MEKTIIFIKLKQTITKGINSFIVKGCILILILISFSCKPGGISELTDQEKNQISAEIETVVDNFFNPNTLNYETHTALRADREGYIGGSDGKIVSTDYESYKEGVKLAFENIERFIQLERTKTYIYVLALDAATCTTEFLGQYVTMDGDTIVHNGCWTFVFKKFDNEWKVIQENGTHTAE